MDANLYQRLKEAIKSITAKYSNIPSDELEDIENSILIGTFIKLQKGKEIKDVIAYVKKSASNQCKSYFRKYKRDRKIAEFIKQSQEKHEKSTFDKDIDKLEILSNQQIAEEAFQSLSKECKEFIELYFKQSLSYKEVSEKLSISISAARKRKGRCREKIRKLFFSKKRGYDK